MANAAQRRIIRRMVRRLYPVGSRVQTRHHGAGEIVSNSRRWFTVLLDNGRTLPFAKWEFQ